MTRRIMFTGVEGIGKSETALKLNRVLPDYFYVPSFAGAVAKKMGFDLNKPFTSRQLITYQEQVLETFIESYKATAFMDTIYDRSPNDIGAYLVRSLDYDSHKSFISDFATRCRNATREYCDILIYPEADLKNDVKHKFNRPNYSSANRMEFDKLLDWYANLVSKDCHVIDVPLQYQFDARAMYIYEKIKEYDGRRS